MWERLSAVYDDPGAAITAALSKQHSLQRPGEEFRNIVSFINEVESIHAQLEEMEQVNCISVRDVDYINNLLPINIKMEWNRRYGKLPLDQKTRPFSAYLEYLEEERSAIIRVAGISGTTRPHKRSTMIGQTDSRQATMSCVIHGNTFHKTKDCRTFERKSIKEKFDILKKEKLCFKCFLKHGRDECQEPNCEHCGRSHSSLLCFHPSKSNEDSSENNDHVSNSYTANTASAVLPIGNVEVPHGHRSASALFDSSSDTSYVTYKFADKMGLKAIEKAKLDVTTMGNVTTTVATSIYMIPLQTTDGEVIQMRAYGLKEITGRIFKLDIMILRKLFPNFNCEKVQRRGTEVDLLIGCDNFGLHPKREVAKAGRDLSIMSGKLGICIQGAHNDLVENTQVSSNCVRTVHGTHSFHSASRIHPLFVRPNDRYCLLAKMAPTRQDNFIKGEELGTTVDPKCGSCKCGKCPLPGHTLSFQEEQELKMIQQGLSYDAQEQKWTASYPWITSPSQLPDNYFALKATLRSLEKSLARDRGRAISYAAQLQDMLDRGVSRKLSPMEIQQWKGPTFYISHLAVISPKSASTPIRIVFNSSQSHNGISLNSCLAKGPDSYTNTIVGLLLRWRENHVAVAADIRKMFHSVNLAETEIHCHRFLWRDFDTSKEPDIYVIQRVNMGDRPAAAIATEALRLTAEACRESHPRAAEFIINSSYVDDLVDSVSSIKEATELAQQTNDVLQTGGFKIKCWQFSSQTHALDAKAQKITTSLLKGAVEEETSILGANWNPVDDCITFHASLNFSSKKGGVNSEPDLKEADLPESLPHKMTRRMVLRQVMSIYDPLGLISPFTLKAKLLLRKTWEKKLGWDELMPEKLHTDWVECFISQFKLEQLKFERVLKPTEPCDSPWLILFSDGSELAYGFVAYIRWRLQAGGYWCRMVMSKNRIAPLHKTTIPRMELNAAVLSKRGRKVLEKELRIKFEKILHLIDSQTVLSMLHKTSTRFKLYEGSRIGEIQNATNGDLSDWAWLPGNNNIADCITRGLSPDQITETSEWWKGPPMLYTDFEEWGIKFGPLCEEKLPGEKTTCLNNISSIAREFPFKLDRFSTIEKIRIVMARVLGMAKEKSFKGGKLKKT